MTYQRPHPQPVYAQRLIRYPWTILAALDAEIHPALGLSEGVA